MTAPHPPHEPPAPGPEEAPAAVACPNCDAPLRPGQDWCLHCGEAVTTHVAGAPGWRTPVAIVGVVLALAAAALVVAFLELSDDAERDVAVVPSPTATVEPGQSATQPVPTVGDTQPLPSPEATPGATVTPEATIPGTGETGRDDADDADDGSTPGTTPGSTPGATPGEVGEWPEGRTAYTVILASETSRAAAGKKADRFADAGRSVGILDSDDFSSLNPGYFVVFHGQYDDLEAARDAAAELRSLESDAYARRVEPK